MDPQSSPWGSADDAIARVNQQIVEAQERAAKASEVRAEMDALRGTATSPRGEVVATADVSGRLVDLELTPDAIDRTPTALAALILATAKAAAAKAGQLAVEQAAAAFGEDSPVTEHLRTEIGERNPAVPGESTIGYA
jgi:DNA-binding protein YbaB